MRIGIFSYSMTGNNDALAEGLASALGAEHFRVEEKKPRTNGRIFFDLICNRTPPVQLPAAKPEGFDLVVFVAPVWVGQVATPLRACFKEFASKIGSYAFVSISGGADGPNPKLSAELKKRLAKEPEAVVDLHIADLLPFEPKPRRKDTSAYRITEDEVRKLAGKAVSELRVSVPMS